MKLKKLPYHLLLLLLTLGASLILGFLSFGGMLALTPIIPLAFAAFVLSVIYEGEIYLQNIKGALNKLFNHNYIKLNMTNAYILDLFSNKHLDLNAEDCPKFFKDYALQCGILKQFAHKSLDTQSRKRKKQAEKALLDMEKWFARQLFNQGENDTLITSEYQKNLHAWLEKNGKARWVADFNSRKTKFHLLKGFSTLAAVFMGAGTTYLLAEAFSVIPLTMGLSLSALPWIIGPMAIVAGAAYGLLTYNAMTDMLTNNRVLAAYKKIFASNAPWTKHRIFMAISGVFLVTLAVVLTVCTAGTWWTVAKQVEPVFAWMKNLPGIVMGVINPIITGISALIFNLQNTAESLEIIGDLSPPEDGPITQLKKLWQSLKENEHWLQWLNPFRLILKLTVTPLRILFFLGHLISIGVTADRVPGISQILSAIIGIISEGFEDLHYFVPHSHGGECCGHEHGHDHGVEDFIKTRLTPGHGHSHDGDIPTRFLRFIFSPIYALAALWDSKASQMGSKKLTLEEAWNKQRGNEMPEEEGAFVPDEQHAPSTGWKVEHIVYQIERHKEKQLSGAIIGRDVALKKVAALSQLQKSLLSSEGHPKDVASIKEQFQAEQPKGIYKQHRFFLSKGDTATSRLLNELPEQLPEAVLCS
jgi:hypothetical protein